MPIYPHQCLNPNCKGNRKELRRAIKNRDIEVLCEKCGMPMAREITTFYNGTWKPITLEHINVEGEGDLTFTSRKSLRDYCNKHGLESGAL